jgi:hypothetical protein
MHLFYNFPGSPQFYVVFFSPNYYLNQKALNLKNDPKKIVFYNIINNFNLQLQHFYLIFSLAYLDIQERLDKETERPLYQGRNQNAYFAQHAFSEKDKTVTVKKGMLNFV